ncbi:competence protein ComK, partial [Indiicoccus explosivorum]|uniref:competence protein ComK n=1 Tax=Indiicoccus explosivorum TaxID=1917864 RepID=UPI00158813D1
KTPVLISPSGVGAFPTMSPNQPECAWIFNQDYMIEPMGREVRLTFESGFSLLLNVSAHTIKRQKSRLIETLYYYSGGRDPVHH